MTKFTSNIVIGMETTKQIWNKNIADQLAYCYYDSVLEGYEAYMKKDVENFGFNTFADGIKVSLDIILPLLDDGGRKIVKNKIKSMLKIRRLKNGRKNAKS